MTEIRAFVGHSFTPDDADVVSAFLLYFDQVSSLLPAFTWEHATASEPVDLREKVLARVEGKNTFIGICTRKERAVAESDFANSLFSSSKLLVVKDKAVWKTSDWIIQEIGLAIGRGMAVILLVEEGVRSPGGLQGNIEYLPFRREAPEATFGKLLEMITALSPPSVSSSPSTETVADEPAAAESTQAAVLGQPTPEWTHENYRSAYFQRLLKDDALGAEQIASAYLSSAISGELKERVIWDAQTEWLRIILDKGGSLEKMRATVSQNPDSADAHSYLASTLAHYGENLEAAGEYREAGRLEDDPAKAVSQLCFAAIHEAKGHRPDSAMQTMSQARSRAPGVAEAKRHILKALEQIAEITADEKLRIEALEGLSAMSPEDASLRFSVAYQHGQGGNEDLAFSHYLKAPEAERHATWWNNLGVAFQEFKMPGKAVDAYRRSAAAGESLAMSNLAYKFMEVGFLDEATAQFEAAIQIEDHHKNVDQGFASLKSVPENEEKAQLEVLAKASEKLAFYREAGKAIADPDTSISPTWSGPLCPLKFEVSGDAFRASGEYERKNSLLMSASGSDGARTRYFIQYVGTILGRRLVGTVTRTTDQKAPPTSLLSVSDDTKPVLMVVSEDGRTIRAMEEPQSRRPTFYEFVAS